MAQEWNQNIVKIVTTKTTGAAGLAYSVMPTPRTGFELIDYRLHCGTSPATAENLTVTINSIDGAVYDTNISTTDMNAVDDLYENFDEMYCKAGDTIDFAWTNTNTVTYGLIVRYRRLS